MEFMMLQGYTTVYIYIYKYIIIMMNMLFGFLSSLGKWWIYQCPYASDFMARNGVLIPSIGWSLTYNLWLVKGHGHDCIYPNGAFLSTLMLNLLVSMKTLSNQTARWNRCRMFFQTHDWGKKTTCFSQPPQTSHCAHYPQPMERTSNISRFWIHTWRMLFSCHHWYTHRRYKIQVLTG